MLELMISNGKSRSSGVTYAKFLEYLASTNVFEQSPAGLIDSVSRYIKIKIPAAFTGIMWGTPYLNYLTYDSAANRIAQHAFPTQAITTDNQTNLRYVMLKYNYVGSRSGYQGVTRNGYVSSTYGSFNGGFCDDFIYWDAGNNCMMRYNPLTNSTPVVFDLTMR